MSMSSFNSLQFLITLIIKQNIKIYYLNSKEFSKQIFFFTKSRKNNMITNKSDENQIRYKVVPEFVFEYFTKHIIGNSPNFIRMRANVIMRFNKVIKNSLKKDLIKDYPTDRLLLRSYQLLYE